VPADLVADLETFGLFFESLCIRDLRIYSQRIGGTISQYHDSDGLEADAVIHLNDGRWGAIEIKLGANEAIESAAKKLMALKEKVMVMREPAFLAVVTGTQFAYRRPDGVYVIPIGCLKN
jgi:predicted AAA+ superfamily ATPase